MRVCFLDVETTGLEAAKDRVTELAFAVREVQDDVWEKKCDIIGSYLLWDEARPVVVPEFITDLTGVTEKLLRRAGIPDHVVANDFLSYTEDCDYFIAHNAAFDRGFLAALITGPGVDITHSNWSDNAKWICSQADIEHGFKSNHLNYLAAEHGFLNPFPHAALFDVFTMMRIVEQTPFSKVVERAKMPWVTLRALVSFDDKDKAKERRYRWEDAGDGVKHAKCWVKNVKQDQAEKEIAAAGFKVVVIE